MIESSKRSVFSSYSLVFVLLSILFLFACRFALIHGLPTHFHEQIARLHWFEVNQVRIQAEWPLKEEWVRAQLPKFEGRSLLTVQPNDIYVRLKEKPWVQEVSVKKEYPDGLVIHVETKKARAITFLSGLPYFIDSNGKTIERVSKGNLQARDLPFISNLPTPFPGHSKWNLENVLSLHSRLKTEGGNSIEISEIQLTTYPILKVFLSRPKIEILFSAENWNEQLSYLLTLLNSSPSQIGQIHKINLVFPKKAIVTRHN